MTECEARSNRSDSCHARRSKIPWRFEIRRSLQRAASSISGTISAASRDAPELLRPPPRRASDSNCARIHRFPNFANRTFWHPKKASNDSPVRCGRVPIFIQVLRKDRFAMPCRQVVANPRDGFMRQLHQIRSREDVGSSRLLGIGKVFQGANLPKSESSAQRQFRFPKLAIAVGVDS
jgi:hypothetical protein